MDWDPWAPTYRAILDDFGWDEAADRAASEALIDRLPRHSAWRLVGTELKHRPRVVVVGCGPGLDTLQAADLPQGVVVAADGATDRLRELGVVPRVVVTDLDGPREGLQWAADQGATMVVHAHGDNVERLPMVDDLGPFVVGTCQHEPMEPLRNHGGFTDGDRAVLMAEHYQARSIHVACFDTRAPGSIHSGDTDPDLKARKLDWCRRILDDAAKRVPITGAW